MDQNRRNGLNWTEMDQTRKSYKRKAPLYIYIWYKIEILLKPNLSVYVCEALFWRLEPWFLSPHPTSIYTCEVTISLRVCGGSSYYINMICFIKKNSSKKY